ncbi:MAG: Fe2+-dependent dioxygenase [Pseudomonadota bacterium]|nr:Fe2+-dependent dioxygenase [Pseudomonadota bacterium]
MLITIENVLTAGELASIHEILARSAWVDGFLTSGPQAAKVQRNQELPEGTETISELRRQVMAALQRNALLFAAAFPARFYPPIFNRYGGTANFFGDHVDNAVRPLPDGSGYVRRDVSATLFLTEPSEYDGGELVIEDIYGIHAVKGQAGSMVVYPSSSIHRVEPVTRGFRTSCVVWLQSMVRDAGQRRLLFDIDMALVQLRQQVGDIESVVHLTGTYHNLLRRWAET